MTKKQLIYNDFKDRKDRFLKIYIVLFIILLSISLLQFLTLYSGFIDKQIILNDKTAQINIIQQNYTDLYQTLNTTINKIIMLKIDGKQILHNPTHDEAMDFIKNDETDKNSYDDNYYNCGHFSRDFNNEAEQNGLICAYVEISLNGSVPHAIVAFNTTDQGLVFIEPQTDEIVNLQINLDYWNECIITNNPQYEYDPDNIVIDYRLYW